MYALRTQMLLQVAHEHISLLGLQASAGVILEQVTLEADQIAAHGQVVGSQFHPYAGSLQRASPLIYKMLVIAQDAAVGHLAAGVEAVWHSFQKPVAAIARQIVEMRSVGILEQRLALQFGARPVGHAIAQYDEMFHITIIYRPQAGQMPVCMPLVEYSVSCTRCGQMRRLRPAT